MVRVEATAIWRGFELFECLLVVKLFDVLCAATLRRSSTRKPSVTTRKSASWTRLVVRLHY